MSEVGLHMSVKNVGAFMYLYKDTEKLKSPGTHFILAVLLQAGGRTPHSEMNKLTLFI
jgi:hypothetical protein